MADPTAPPEVWNWLDSVWGFGAGVVAGVMGMVGWANPKFKAVNKKIEQVSKEVETAAQHAHQENDDLAWELHGRIGTMEKLVVTLEEKDKAHIELYRGLQGTLIKLSDKTDEQTNILHELVGEMKAIKDQRR